MYTFPERRRQELGYLVITPHNAGDKSLERQERKRVGKFDIIGLQILLTDKGNNINIKTRWYLGKKYSETFYLKKE